MSEAKTPGEELFGQYLLLNAYNFRYEEEQAGKSKRPDYSICQNGTKILCEVKDFKPYSFPNRVGSHDPYPGIRQKIEAARKKFHEYKEEVCCLVMYNQGDMRASIEKWFIVFGAMYGDAGIQCEVSAETGAAVTEPEFAFLDRGKMLRPKTKQPQNTGISALITIRNVNIGGMNLEMYLKEHPDIHGEAILYLTNEIVGFDLNEKCVGVIVWENAFAARPLPREVFSGPYDIRLRMTAKGAEVVHSGEALPKVPFFG